MRYWATVGCLLLVTALGLLLILGIMAYTTAAAEETNGCRVHWLTFLQCQIHSDKIKMYV